MHIIWKVETVNFVCISFYIELPKHVYDALLHCGLCMVKINQSNDPVTTAILLDLAIGETC